MENSKKDIGKSLLIGVLLGAAFWKVMKMLNNHFEKKSIGL